MTYPIRPITPDELPMFARTAELAFGEVPGEEDLGRWRQFFEFERSLAAFDGERIVGTAGAFSFDLTLPGLTTLPAAGVSFVGVLPTHRRRGILRALMQRQLDDIHARGEALAILTASESLIYGRFGYGMATSSQTLEIDPRHGAFAQPPDAPGSVAFADRATAAAILPGVYDRVRRLRPGAVTRNDVWWKLFFEDPEKYRDGASERFYVTYTAPSGQVDGYLSYRIKGKWENGFSDSALLVYEVMAATPASYAALWRFALSVDLIGTVRTRNSPVDEPLRWMLADPRRLRVVTYADFLWLRILDIPAALSGRRYLADDSIVFEVSDRFRPDTGGRYELDGSPEGATCRVTAKEADLVLDMQDLGAAYLGGVRFSTLARAGRVSERTPGALCRADALFVSDPAPWCGTDF